ncbi:MAG: thioredoxin family protein [Chitinophagaceae bacterium]
MRNTLFFISLLLLAFNSCADYRAKPEKLAQLVDTPFNPPKIVFVDEIPAAYNSLMIDTGLNYSLEQLFELHQQYYEKIDSVNTERIAKQPGSRKQTLFESQRATWIFTDLYHYSLFKCAIALPRNQRGFSFFGSGARSTLVDRQKAADVFLSYPKHIRTTEIGKRRAEEIFQFKENKGKMLANLAGVQLTDTLKNIRSIANIISHKTPYHIVVFSADWCAPCKFQSTLLSKWMPTLNKTGLFTCTTISIDKNHEAFVKHSRENELVGGNFRIEGEFNNPIFQEYKIRSVPTILLLNGRGELIDQGNDIAGIVRKIPEIDYRMR